MCAARSSACGPHTARPGAGKVFVGSRKRLRRLSWRENTPLEIWILFLLILIMFVVLIRSIWKNTPDDTHRRFDWVLGKY